MPLKVLRAAFHTPTATGSVLFDAAKDRVSRAEETFRVNGRVTVAALSGEAVVDLEERQDFQLTVREPADRTLKGGPGR